MMKAPKDMHFQKYISDTIKKRMEEIGMSKYRLVQDNPDTTNKTTLNNILKGAYSTNIKVLAHYCDLIGLEIVIRPKTQRNETEDK